MTIIRPRLRVLHCSDMHLDVHTGDLAFDIVRKTAALQKALGVDLVLIAGDIFDSTRQPPDFVADVAEAFLEFQAPIIAIPGNHDVVYDHRDPASELFSLIEDRGVYLSSLEGQTVVAVDGRMRVWGRGMPEHSPKNDPLANLESMAYDAMWNVVLAHGELLTAGDRTMLSSPIYLRDHRLALGHIDYVALGHYHFPSQMIHGNTVMRYSGAATTVGGAGVVTLIDFSSEDGLMTFSYVVE